MLESISSISLIICFLQGVGARRCGKMVQPADVWREGADIFSICFFFPMIAYNQTNSYSGLKGFISAKRQSKAVLTAQGGKLKNKGQKEE